MHRMPSESLQIVLKYEGPEVDDGSMSIQDIVPVLDGFASAYGKIASEYGAGSQHRLRITGVTKSSANILLEIWETLDKASGPLTSLQVIGGGAVAIIGAILWVIRLKRHTKGEPYKDAVGDGNIVTVTNSKNVSIVAPTTVYNIFRSGLIDRDVAKIASPLDPGRINAAEISSRSSTGEDLRERIEAEERSFFDIESITIAHTTEAWFVVRLNSLTKSTESGYLHLADGTRAFYEFKGTNPRQLHEIFGHDGPVRVKAVAHLDESLKPQRLEIFAIERVQGELFPDHKTVADLDTE